MWMLNFFKTEKQYYDVYFNVNKDAHFSSYTILV